MYLGGLVEESGAAELYDVPLHPYTRALMSAVPVPDPQVEDSREQILLTGDLPSPANPPTGCRFHTRCPWRQETLCDTERPQLRVVEVPGASDSHRVACHFAEQIAVGRAPAARGGGHGQPVERPALPAGAPDADVSTGPARRPYDRRSPDADPRRSVSPRLVGRDVARPRRGRSGSGGIVPPLVGQNCVERAPVAQAGRVRLPVAGLLGEPDRGPHRLDLALGGAQVVLVGLVAQDLAVAEVDQLEHRRHDAAQLPDDERVELHLEQRLGLVALARALAGLVVHDADPAVGRHVDAVDEPAEQQLGVEERLDVELALGGLEAARVLEVEVAVEHGAARRRARRRGRGPPRRTSRPARAPPRAARPRPAPACRRPARACGRAPGRSKRSSSTLWTTVPRTASGDGASGSRSMVRKRYISGQAMKSPARLGEIAPEHVDAVDRRRDPLGG